MYFPRYFKGLFDFGYQRRGLEIPTFYFTYFIGSIMAGAIVGVLISALMKSDHIRIQWNLDLITASILFLIITHFIIKKKGLGNEIKIIWLLPLATAALTLFTGHILGLIIPTILSARPNKNTVNKTNNAQQTAPSQEQASPTNPITGSL